MLKVSKAVATTAILSCLFLRVDGASAGTLTTLHDFDRATEGWFPNAGLAYDNGVLYGTTQHSSGTLCGKLGCGTLFSVNATTGTEKVITDFSYTERFPSATLAIAGKTTYGVSGVTRQPGTIFETNIQSGNTKMVHQFESGTDGGNSSELILVDGVLYGTADYGGASGGGYLYSIDRKTHVKTVLHDFQSIQSDGSAPIGRLTAYKGSLYGVTRYGPGSINQGPGTIFRYDLSVKSYQVSASFQNSASILPWAGLTNDGVDIYGVAHGTAFGGNYSSVFRFDPVTAQITTLHVFSDANDQQYLASPLLVVGKFLYGTAASGPNYFGTLFKVDKKTGAEQIIYNFKGTTDGFLPTGELVFQEGAFFGVTVWGGPSGSTCRNGCGTVFKFVP